MRVEVRTRADESSGRVAVAARRQGRRSHSSPALLEAYQDNCFESPTRFFIAAPDHPKLGKWTHKPPLESNVAFLQAPHGNLGSSSAPTRRIRKNFKRGDKRHVSFSRESRRCLAQRSSTFTAKTSTTLREGRGSSWARRRQRTEEDGSHTPPLPRWGASSRVKNSPPTASARKAPRISTPISGRVAQLHPRGTPRVSQAPQCTYLWGSFRERQQHVPESASTSNESLSVGDGGGTTEENKLDVERRGQLSCDLVPIESQGAESPSGVQGTTPEVRYRVRLGEGAPNPPRGSHDGESEERHPPPQQEEARRSPKHESRGEHLLPATGCAPEPTNGREPPTAAGFSPSPHDQSQEPIRSRMERTDGSEREIPAADENEAEVEAVADGWARSQVDPFLCQIREALLRERPVDVPGFVATFTSRQEELKRPSSEDQNAKDN